MTAQSAAIRADGAMDWLLAAAAVWLGTRPRPLDHPTPDWNRVQQLARVHNLEPLLHHLATEKKIDRAGIPQRLLESWEDAYFRNYMFNSELLASFGELLSRSQQEGIQVVALKGPVSIARFYGDPALRVMVDLDLLCSEESLSGLAAIARALGYRLIGETAEYHHEYYHPELQAGLDLHFRLYGLIDNGEEFEQRIRRDSRSLRIGGLEFPAPSPEASQVIVLAHLLHHDLEVDLRHLLDFAAGILAVRGPEAERSLRQLLKRSDLDTEFILVGAVASDLLGLPSQALREGPGEGVRAAQAADALREYLAHRDQYWRRGALAEAAARPGLGARAAYVVRFLVSSANRRRALSTGAEGGNAFWRHIRQTAARGWRKLRYPPPRPSPLARIGLKRSVYTRRGR